MDDDVVDVNVRREDEEVVEEDYERISTHYVRWISTVKETYRR